MTVQKYYVVKDRDTIKVIYQITVKLDIGDRSICEEMFLDDVIEYTVKTQEVLSKIPEFEEQVKKKEQELEVMATKLSEILRILNSMKYDMIKEESIIRVSINGDPSCGQY